MSRGSGETCQVTGGGWWNDSPRSGAGISLAQGPAVPELSCSGSVFRGAWRVGMMHFHPVPRAIDDEVSVTSFAAKAAVMVAEQMTVRWTQEHRISGPRPPRTGMRQNSQRMFSTPPCRRNRRQQQTGSASIVIPHADIVYLPTRKRVML